MTSQSQYHPSIQKILNFAARVISGRRKFDHVSDVRDALGWLDSSQLFHHQSPSLLRKIIQTREPECIASQISANRDNPVHVCSTRQDHLLQAATSHPNGGRPATFSEWNRTAIQRAACSYSWTEGRQVQSTAEVMPAWYRRWLDWTVSYRIISVTTLAFTDFTMPLLSFICIIVPFECVYECVWVYVVISHLSCHCMWSILLTRGP